MNMKMKKSLRTNGEKNQWTRNLIDRLIDMRVILDLHIVHNNTNTCLLYVIIGHFRYVQG